MENQEQILNNDEITVNYVEEQVIISWNKFLLLCIATFGLYQIWWIYKSWRFFQQNDRLDIIPAARTIFSIFFLYSLFNQILDFAKKKGYKYSYPPLILYIIIIFFAWKFQYSSTYLYFLLFYILNCLLFIPPFIALNFAKQNSNHFKVTKQNSFNTVQIVLIIIGLIFWVVILSGNITNEI